MDSSSLKAIFQGASVALPLHERPGREGTESYDTGPCHCPYLIPCKKVWLSATEQANFPDTGLSLTGDQRRRASEIPGNRGARQGRGHLLAPRSTRQPKAEAPIPSFKTVGVPEPPFSFPRREGCRHVFLFNWVCKPVSKTPVQCPSLIHSAFQKAP